MRTHIGLMTVFLGVALACAAPGASPSTLQAQAAPLLYVCNQEEASIAVVDLVSNEIVATIDLQRLGFSPTAKPHHTAVEPDGSYWYLSLIGESKVLKFSRTNELVAQADFATPGMLALHPTEDFLFVGRSMSAVNPPSRIGILRRSTMEIEEVDVVFPRPHALAMTPGGEFVYTASLAENQIASLDTDTEALELTTVHGDHVHTFVQFAVAPDGGAMVATGEMSGQVLFFDLANPIRPSLVAAVDVNQAPWHPTYTRDGRYVYVGNQRANTVTVIDVTTHEVAAVIRHPALAQPHGIAVSPDGRHVYVSNRNLSGEYRPAGHAEGSPNGNVVVIDIDTREVVKVIEVGRGPSGLSVGTTR